MTAQLERCDITRFEDLAPQWEELRSPGAGPFLTVAWLSSWWRAFAPGQDLGLLLRANDGSLAAGGCLLNSDGALKAAANLHSNDWGIVARGPEAESSYWRALAALGRPAVTLQPLAAVATCSECEEALRRADYRLVREELGASPWMALPGSFDELLATRSRNLRVQLRRRQKSLKEEGTVTFRTTCDGPTLERELESFFALEAAGWKGRAGTAIALDARLLDLYRRFAEEASERGWLRLFALELDGHLIAVEYGCVLDGCGFTLKSAFDENFAHFSPGFVLMARSFDAYIDEGLSRYDFLGGPDAYKLRWTDGVRERVALHAFRGIKTIPAFTWRRTLRPALKSVRRRARAVVVVNRRAS